MNHGILGGGALGLVAAYRLASAATRVTIYERETGRAGWRPGSRSATPGWRSSTITSSAPTPRIAALIDELGLGERLLWPRPRTVTLWGGKRYQLDSRSPVLRFTPLSLVERVRIGGGARLPEADARPAPLEGKLAAPWLRRWMGEGPYRVVWGPLLRGKFGATRRRDRAALVLGAHPRPHDRTRLPARRLPVLSTTASSSAYRGAGRQVDLGVTVTRRARRADGKAAPSSPTPGRPCFDRVISTLPPRLLCRLAPDLPADYRERHDWGRAYGAHCLILALDRSLTDSYWMQYQRPWLPLHRPG